MTTPPYMTTTSGLSLWVLGAMTASLLLGVEIGRSLPDVGAPDITPLHTFAPPPGSATALSGATVCSTLP